jgi:hypothetical protein
MSPLRDLIELVVLVLLFALNVSPSSAFSVQDVELNLDKDYFEDYNTNSKLSLNYVNQKLDFKNLPPIKSFPSLEGNKTLKPGEIPGYVFEYNPIVYLYTEEKYLPYDIEDFVQHFQLQYRNKSNITNGSLTLQNLSDFAKDPNIDTSETFLTSLDAFENNPDWLTGKNNKPSPINGKTRDAPSLLIVVDKGNGWVDAYWFYFYSFNLGPFVMGHGPYGNHVGDWEHSLTRFYKGIPVFVWMSAHGGGGAYHYEALEKSDIDGNKPIIFSARGTHANYPSTGQHPHDLPFGILSDFTDRGALWDPSKNFLGYTWDGTKVYPINNSSDHDNSKEVKYGDWLLFKGHWGDDKLAPNDPRQVWSPWEWKYIEGPTGPLTKHLNRKQLCQRSKWWNFWSGCPAKNFKNLGGGYEKEPGVQCANLFSWVKPTVLSQLVNYITRGGGLCFVMNWLYG